MGPTPCTTAIFGPDDARVPAQLKAIDEVAGDLIDFYRNRGTRVLVVSEYGISKVGRCVHPNRLLRQAGLLSVRGSLTWEMLDAGASPAFAVSDHQIAHVYVKDKAREQLVKKLATAEASKVGEARLAALKANAADTAGLEAAVTVSRAKPQGLTRAQLEAVLGADTGKLPAAVGIAAEDGSYVVARINQLQPRDAAVIDDKRAAQQYANAWSRAEGQAYLAALKSQYKAVIKVAAPASAASAP